ncbi:MAG TPA: hypothetical protein VFD58_33160 [Blastocatellia bacterium]|nr:hypothetical protein [Blastocatellia bacterium]
MKCLRLAGTWFFALALLINFPVTGNAQTMKPATKTAPPPASASATAWTLDEALAQLRLHPTDAYLQYVALQLAQREKKVEQTAELIEQITRADRWSLGTGRRAEVDLFSIFTGALAVQESLQLDTMRGNTQLRDETLGPRPARWLDHLPPEEKKAQEARLTAEARKEMEQDYQRQLAEWEKRRAEVAEKVRLRQRKKVDVASITGPTIKSHPWAEMLAGRQPEISPLARCVPEDFYFAEFHSLGKLLDAADTSDLWSTHLFNQAYREARTHNAGERLKGQLALETNTLLRPFYDLVVEEVAITGSDLFLREGSDVTMIFRYKQPEIFKARMDGFLDGAEKKRPDAKRSTGNYLGVDFVQVATPDRDISVISAYPAPGLHVRSNSRIAFEKVIAAIQGKAANGKAAPRLGDTKEFAYIRTLMPRGAKEEDGLIYLSDPFIRRLVGPQLKLTERRRVVCYNHLRMISHAALMYQTEHGRLPASLETLAQSQCSPGLFGAGALVCPDGGRYSLAADGMTGVCSHHGNARFLNPCAEIPVSSVSGEEAEQYKQFLDDYNQYWRTFFDPIALRLQITPQQYRLETIVLPLIDNSVYTGLATVLGGEPEPLDGLPVPKRNIFSVGFKINKDALLQQIAGEAQKQGAGERPLDESLMRALGIPESQRDSFKVTEFLSRGLGNQIGLHIYDAPMTFDLNLPSLFGELAGVFGGRGFNTGTTELLIGFAIASLNSPVYISIPVRDEKVVDEFLNKLDPTLAATAIKRSRGGFSLDFDFFRFMSNQSQPAEQATRAYGVRFGPAKLRFFWARVGKGLYIASKPFIIDDLIAANAEPAKSPEDQAAGHAMLRMRPQNWNQVLPDFRLGWAENNREACLNNLSAIMGAGRAITARASGNQAASEDQRSLEAHEYADKFYAVHFFCPEGGRYQLSADGRNVSCSVHGSILSPRQPTVPDEKSDLGRLLREFTGLTATLDFTEEGLRAVVTINRK